jgi:hypothetical protein
VAAAQDFSNDEERPPFAEHIEGASDRAELAQSFHGTSIEAFCGCSGTDSVLAVLHAAREVHPFYVRCGFSPAPDMLRRDRKF